MSLILIVAGLLVILRGALMTFAKDLMWESRLRRARQYGSDDDELPERTSEWERRTTTFGLIAVGVGVALIVYGLQRL